MPPAKRTAAPRNRSGTGKPRPKLALPKAPGPTSWTGPRKPRDLNEVVRVVPTDGGEPRRVTLVEAACEALRLSANMADAAARCGVDVDTLRAWRRSGARAIGDVLAGRRKLGALSPAERAAAEFHERATQAEQDGQLYLVGLLQREAQGGYAVVKTKVKVERRRQADGSTVEVEVGRETVTETARPNTGTLQWMLANRDPENYGRRRLEVTGADGGPIPMELRSASDSLLEELGRMAAAEEELGGLVEAASSNGKAKPAKRVAKRPAPKAP